MFHFIRTYGNIALFINLPWLVYGTTARNAYVFAFGMASTMGCTDDALRAWRAAGGDRLPNRHTVTRTARLIDIVVLPSLIFPAIWFLFDGVERGLLATLCGLGVGIRVLRTAKGRVERALPDQTSAATAILTMWRTHPPSYRAVPYRYAFPIFLLGPVLFILVFILVAIKLEGLPWLVGLTILVAIPWLALYAASRRRNDMLPLFVGQGA